MMHVLDEEFAALEIALSRTRGMIAQLEACGIDPRDTRQFERRIEARMKALQAARRRMDVQEHGSSETRYVWLGGS